MRKDRLAYEPTKPSAFEVFLNLLVHIAVLVSFINLAGVLKGLLAFIVALKVKESLLLNLKGLESIAPMDY